ncbi:D-alanine--D-alanine ligase [Buchnera aphidicola]|uniref:D-alanine--D-alanine ligase n=1 Tax=Buchnera aphidicola TaxID=9 RepID=UPI0005C626ED|nr:D-alanine--D-alanine ligase [Buchnera aphidicola]
MTEKIAVLLGGTSQERNISLISGYNILNSLLKSGIHAVAIDTKDFPITQLPHQKFTKAFIALHGRDGEDGTIQSVLKYLNIPFTGSKTLPSAISINKFKTKLLWQSFNLPVVPYLHINKHEFNKKFLQKFKKNISLLGLPIIVKPNQEGSSIGITIVYSYETLYKACKTAFIFDNSILIEKFIYGEEYTISILGKKILPIIRICPENTFYNYNSKYLSNRTTYFCPSGLNKLKELELKKITLTAWNIIDGTGWGRVDVIMDYKNKFWLLEANTCPGMTDHSLFPMSAKKAGISYQILVQKILELAN